MSTNLYYSLVANRLGGRNSREGWKIFQILIGGAGGVGGSGIVGGLKIFQISIARDGGGRIFQNCKLKVMKNANFIQSNFLFI